MAYTYYQAQPGWGTRDYQFAAPPAPKFMPQPTWGGRDYYLAATTSPDVGIFDSTWNRIRGGGASGLGVGFSEARHWHRRAYAGLGEPSIMSATQLGAAAAYEAYRTWVHNDNLYDSIDGRDELQREALCGLAVAEATRLWHSVQNRMDRVGLQTACEVAAATASLTFDMFSSPEDQIMRMNAIGRSPAMSHSALGAPAIGPPPASGYAGSIMGGGYGGSAIGVPPSPVYPGSTPRTIPGTVVGGGGYGGSVIGSQVGGLADPYAYDDEIYRERRRRRKHHRHRRHSFTESAPPTIINVGGGGVGAPMQLGGGATYATPYGQQPMQLQPGVQYASSAGAAPNVTILQPQPAGMAAYGAGGYPGATGAYGAQYPAYAGGGGIPSGGGVLNPLPAGMNAAYQAQMAAQFPGALPNIGGVVPGQALGGFGGPGSIIDGLGRRERARSREREAYREERVDEEHEARREARREERRRRRYSDAAAYGAPGVGGMGAGGFVPPPASSAYRERY